MTFARPGFGVRKNDRITIRRMLKLPCVVVRESTFRPIASATTDVSIDGMQVMSDSDVELGETVLITFRATHLDIWFDTDATIVRINQARRDEDRARTLGLRFDTLDPIARRMLHASWRHVPPPLPKRAARIDYAATVRDIASTRSFV
jgi:c-di-GMP-binding flagellar brake protein YcgR